MAEAPIHLFSPLAQRGARLRNRIVVSPMCEYSSLDGFASDWHLVHLGSRAVGGAALVLTEAIAVTAEGRISPDDLGIWKDEQVPMLRRIVEFVHGQGALAGPQLAHAGRKASTFAPFKGHGRIGVMEGGWEPLAPSAVAFSDAYPMPREMSRREIQEAVEAFAAATRRSVEAGFDVIEIHAAHGYLIHEFYSPFSNRRRDEYGGSLENRMRFACEVVEAVRGAWPEEKPLWMRVSCTDWIEDEGWTVEDTVALARRVRGLGVDLVDCSSGGNVAHAAIPVGAGYQTPFAERVRREAGVASGAVGMITAPAQADHIVRTGQADVVLLARELLRDPYWPLRAGRELGQEAPWPIQYARAK